jgi:hypothetical protein
MDVEMSTNNAWQRTQDFNPDKEAPFRRRVRVFICRLAPLAVLWASVRLY